MGRFQTTLINNQRITKRLFFPSHSQSQSRSERTDEREGCDSEASTTRAAGETVPSTKITSRNCPRNTIMESRPTTNTPFNFKTTISAGIALALATDRRSSSSNTQQQQHQQHCRTVSSSSSSSNNGCMQQQPLFS